MGKQLMRGERAKVGDWIQNDETKEKWVACTCSTCGGSGNGENGHLVVDCPECDGLKLIWREVEY